uniref:Uncharacterized protein n=1 Tax=Parascaris univalens TaxID=6257 RepID=A0A915CF76_PARUN
RLRLGNEVLLQFTHESSFFGVRLKSTVPQLGARVDPLEVDLLVRKTLRLNNQRFAQSYSSFFGVRLKATVPQLGARVDPLEVDLLVRKTLRLNNQRFAQSYRSLFRANAAATDHHEVL